MRKNRQSSVGNVALLVLFLIRLGPLDMYCSNRMEKPSRETGGGGSLFQNLLLDQDVPSGSSEVNLSPKKEVRVGEAEVEKIGSEDGEARSNNGSTFRGLRIRITRLNVKQQEVGQSLVLPLLAGGIVFPLSPRCHD
ncbi:hypothetical protein Tco_0600079 [Tanacetum coccineum]|uniref:Uncharacterized protein n=1 Tax=Tanacetum coccineum TaxID=301880 RepID=A0ABQ4WAW6_9ASTR